MSRESLELEMKNDILNKLLPVLYKRSFNDIKMGDLAKYIGVCRATLYKYFPNKNYILEAYIDGVCSYIENMNYPAVDSKQKIVDLYPKFIEQIISCKIILPREFVEQLKSSSPDLFITLENTIQKNEKLKRDYYNIGISVGAFNNMDVGLLLLQEELIPYLWTTQYLTKNKITLEKSIRNFLEFNIKQLFISDCLQSFDFTIFDNRIIYLSNKIKRILL